MYTFSFYRHRVSCGTQTPFLLSAMYSYPAFIQIGKDPDVRVEKLFVLGEVIPVETAKTQVKVTVPYNAQHMYFFLSKLCAYTFFADSSSNKYNACVCVNWHTLILCSIPSQFCIAACSHLFTCSV